MAAPQDKGMNNLTTLIKRLEAATSRLEDIASSAQTLGEQQGAAPQAHGASTTAAAATTSAPAAAAVGAASTPKAASSAAPDEPQLPQSIVDFDALINGDLKQFTDLSEQIGGIVAEQSAAVTRAFHEQRTWLLMSTKAKKPGQEALHKSLADLQAALEKAEEKRHSNRDASLRDQLSMVSDGVGTLGWVTMDTKPADVVAELFGGAQMWGNKVLKEHKESNPTRVQSVQAFYKLFKSLIAYIKQYHPKGVAWNPQGVDITEALKEVKSGSTNGASSAAAPPPPPPQASSGGPPPPPPPMPANFQAAPPPPPAVGAAQKTGGTDTMGAVFDQLNRGESVTSGLKKVDPSMQTHKNPSLRAAGSAPSITRSDSDSGSLRSKSPAPPGKKPKPEAMRTKKPPRKELDGNKWIIENFESPSDVVEIEANMTQSILITKCKATTIRVSGKANAISLDNSPKTSIILDSLVSSIDVIKCSSFALQVLGTLPTVLLDQVDGATVYLSKESLGTEIFTSKCSSVNINLPAEEEDGDYGEHPVPEQFRSYVKDGKLISEIVEHAG